MTATQADQTIVVINGERQYSLWRAERPLPPGWDAAGPKGTEAECLAAIERLWTDMRPRSLVVALLGDREPAGR